MPRQRTGRKARNGFLPLYTSYIMDCAYVRKHMYMSEPRPTRTYTRGEVGTQRNKQSFCLFQSVFVLPAVLPLIFLELITSCFIKKTGWCFRKNWSVTCQRCVNPSREHHRMYRFFEGPLCAFSHGKLMKLVSLCFCIYPYVLNVRFYFLFFSPFPFWQGLS